MSIDALVICLDPNYKSLIKIIRTDIYTFTYIETIVIGIKGNTQVF
jgi:adenylate cyclase